MAAPLDASLGSVSVGVKATGGVEPGMGPTERSDGFGIMSVTQRRFGAFRRGQSARTIDVFAELGNIAEDADPVVADLYETAVHGDIELAAVGECDASVILRQGTDKWGVTRQEGDLATAEGARDHLRGLTREDDLLG
jgi:hypothetical protein